MDVISLLSLLTLLVDVLTVIVFLTLVFAKISKNNVLWKKVIEFFSKRAIFFAFIVSLTATLGSLYLSEVAHFTPCTLCWYQRIFMYPLTILLAVALIKKSTEIKDYVLPVSAVGLAIAIYHYYLQLYPKALAPCSTIGFSVSCTERFFTRYGYITTPFMSLTAFFLISSLMIVLRMEKK